MYKFEYTYYMYILISSYYNRDIYYKYQVLLNMVEIQEVDNYHLYKYIKGYLKLLGSKREV